MMLMLCCASVVVGRRPPGVTVGEGDVVFNVKTVRWMFDVFNENIRSLSSK